jgi:iron complex outermembrane receptor protein
MKDPVVNLVSAVCLFSFIILAAFNGDVLAAEMPVGVTEAPAVPVGSPEELLFVDIPVVTSATLREQKITSAPAAINVLTGDQIRKRGYRTLKDMVVDIPGWEDVSDSNEVIAAVRGMYASTTNKILIMINGHRMNDLNLGRYNLDQFLGTDIIERVEFIKGPGSVLYGNGALMGVINIITRQGSDLQGFYAHEKTSFYGHNRDYEGSLTWGNNIGDINALVNFTYLDGEGDDIYQPASLSNPPGGSAKKDGKLYYNKYPDNWSLFGSLEYQDNLRLDFRREHYNRAVPRCPANLSFYNWSDELVKPTYQEDITYLDLKYDLFLSETSKLTFNPAITSYHLRELSWISSWGADYLPPYGTRSGQKTNYEQYQLKTIYDNQLKENLDLILGVDTVLANFRSMYGVGGSTGAPFDEVKDQGGRWLLVGGFYQLLWSPIKKLELTIAGRYDTFGQIADPAFTKRFGAVYKFAEGLTAKLLYGESFLSPQWAHLNQVTSGAWAPNPGLKPETFNGWDLIFEYERGKAYINLDFFRNHLKNLISAVGSSYFNIGETTYKGFELEGRYNLLKELQLEGSLSYVANEGNTSDSYLMWGEIKNIPTTIYRLGLKYAPWKNFDIQIWGRYYPNIRTSDAITGENRIKPWVTADISVNYKLKDFDFQLGITNLFDKYYELGGSVNRPMARPGRGVSLSVGYKF